MRYIPHTEDDVARMLRVVGAPSVEALFSHIPQALRQKRPLQIEALDEAALLCHLSEIGERSTPALSGRATATLSFLGAGVVPHYIPTAVDMMLTRAEWYTSYTPYQPEISQGTLQAIFEFQTIVAEIFGPPARANEAPPLLANASMYDGASALAEAVLMARRITGKTVSLLCGALHPQYEAVAACYLQGLGDERPALVPCAFGKDGRVDLAAVDRHLDEIGADLCCVVVQNPNYLGVVEDLRPLSKRAHDRGVLLICACPEPLAFGVLAPPAALGADIVVGEGLGLAIPPTLGGPGVGLLCARADLVRQMPGRLVGETVDQAGRRGYCLTLSTREQHIRREKATSNICTNQGLIALAFTIHLCLLGRRGFQELSQLNLSRTEYAKARLSALRGFSLCVSGPTFNEFALRVRGGRASVVSDRLVDRGILGGVALDRPGFALSRLPGAEEVLLVAVSELHRREHIDQLALALDEVCP